MDSSSQKGEGKRKVTEVKTFPIPFVLEEKDILYKVARESILRFKLKRVQEMVKNSLFSIGNPSSGFFSPKTSQKDHFRKPFILEAKSCKDIT